MQYIVIDLEWNQPMSYQSQVYKRIGNKLIFEIIQIGAVKLDDELKVCDSISIPIRPQHYVKIHPRIRKMTGLGNEELEDAPYFEEAMEQFTAWCGDDYTLLTWGCDDVSVLQQNLDFFDCHPDLPPLCDIQRLFSDINQCRDRKGLKLAMEMLGIEPDENLAFHNALHDAYYTALVFAKLPNPAEVLKYPQQPRQLIHQHRFNNSDMKGELFDSVADALQSPAAMTPNCCVCGKKTELEDSYVMQAPDKYIGLAVCKSHGTMLLKARLQATDEGKCIFG
ncbi:MAG: 3'-5' exonuclease, partial [Clostridia bacterium]|nr:3'-5' exonuclease [Clostridia bacterium]